MSNLAFSGKSTTHTSHSILQAIFNFYFLTCHSIATKFVVWYAETLKMEEILFRKPSIDLSQELYTSSRVAVEK
jgi:hypothetical protein